MKCVYNDDNDKRNVNMIVVTDNSLTWNMVKRMMMNDNF